MLIEWRESRITYFFISISRIATSTTILIPFFNVFAPKNVASFYCYKENIKDILTSI